MIERSEELVTVFGGGGFIGRYVCEFLLKSGVRVRVAQRDPRQAYIIQPLGQVGQFGFDAPTSPMPTASAMRSTAPRQSSTCAACSARKMQRVHVDGARNVAEAARDAGVGSLVQISAIGAEPRSPNRLTAAPRPRARRRFARLFRSATIIRPSLVFGPEDELTNRFAGMARLPFLPVIAAKRNFQPVYVRDLAKAIAMAALDPQRFGGKTYEIGGPQVMSMIELHRAILEITGQKPDLVPLPDFVRQSAVAARLAARRAAHPRPVADAAAGQCAVGRARRARSVRDQADAARRGRHANGSAASTGRQVRRAAN